jgi:hypothetical protein
MRSNSGGRDEVTDQFFFSGVAAGLSSVGLSKYLPDFICADIFSLSFATPSFSDPLNGLVPVSGSSLQPAKAKARTTPAIPKQNRHIGSNSGTKEEAIDRHVAVG